MSQDDIYYGGTNNPSDRKFVVYNTTFHVHASVVAACAPLLNQKEDHSQFLDWHMATIKLDDSPEYEGVPRLSITRSTKMISNYIFSYQCYAPFNTWKHHGTQDQNMFLCDKTRRAEQFRNIFIQIFNACYRRRMKKFDSLEDFASTVEVAHELHFLPTLEADFSAAALECRLDEYAYTLPVLALTAACRIKSDRLYSESYVHVVGLFPVLDYEERTAYLDSLGDVPQEVRQKVEKHAMEVQARVQRLLKTIFCRQNSGITSNMLLGSNILHSDIAAGREGVFLRDMRNRWSLNPSEQEIWVQLVKNTSLHPVDRFAHLTCAKAEKADLPWSVDLSDTE